MSTGALFAGQNVTLRRTTSSPSPSSRSFVTIFLMVERFARHATRKHQTMVVDAGVKMARARNIKPSIMSNDALAELSPLSRLLFVYLWMLADREGRLEDRPKRIAAQALPFDREADVDSMLSELHNANFIVRYSIANESYIQVINFSKHQSPHVREADSTIPEPCQGIAKAVISIMQGGVEALPRSPDSLIPDSLIQKTKATPKPSPPTVSLPDWIPEDAWNGFVEMRKKIRAPMTPRAFLLTIRQLDAQRSNGQDVAAMLDQSTQKGWRGVFPVSAESGNRQNGTTPWWHSNEGIEAKARETGCWPAKGGESYKDLAQRVKLKLEAA